MGYAKAPGPRPAEGAERFRAGLPKHQGVERRDNFKGPRLARLQVSAEAAVQARRVESATLSKNTYARISQANDGGHFAILYGKRPRPDGS